MNPLETLFNPASIALIGASPDPAKLGGIVLQNLRDYTGRLYPVNPRQRELSGIAAYPSAADLPETVDLAVILRPAPEVPAIIAGLKGKARSVVVVSAGFAEVGEVALHEELLRAASQAGVRLLGPNCLGLYNPHCRLDTFFLPHERFRRPPAGNIAVVSQSGAILVSLLDALSLDRCGVSLAVNYGNAADIDAPDIYDYLAADEETGVVVSYLESVADGRRYLVAARRLAERKPLVVLKAGKGELGQAAALSHTGRLAGRYEVFRSLLRQYGIREVRDFEELLDAARALSRQPVGRGQRVCIITNGGGSGVLAADECARQGLELPPLPEELQHSLQREFPPFYVIGNPLDLTGQVTDDQYRLALDRLRESYDGFLVIALSGVAGLTPRLGELLLEFRAGCRKPLVLHIAQGGISDRLTEMLEKGGIPVYATPERAARSLAALLGKGENDA